jgi:hypothetical protein
MPGYNSEKFTHDLLLLDRITYPPKIKSASRTKIAVPEVIIVRLKVSLMLRLIISASPSRRDLRMFSRMRSETMIVSWTEYPTTVRIAANTDRSNGKRGASRATQLVWRMGKSLGQERLVRRSGGRQFAREKETDRRSNEYENSAESMVFLRGGIREIIGMD